MLALLHRVSARFAEVGPETFHGLAADQFADPALVSGLQAQLSQSGNEVMAAILKRAAERGEARDDIPPRVAALPIALLRHELLLSPGDEHAVTEIVDQVFLPLVSRRTRTSLPAGTADRCRGGGNG